MKKTPLTSLFFCAFALTRLYGQEVMKTGGKTMPDTWIDMDTHHKVIRLVNNERDNLSFYFHNNPFIKNKMVFYSSEQKAVSKNNNKKDKQFYLIDLTSGNITRLTNHSSPLKGEIVSSLRNEIFFQIADSVFSLNISTNKEKLLYVFPPDFRGEISTVNADGRLLGGFQATDKEREILKENPDKHEYFNRIFEAGLPRTLFTIDIDNGILKKIFTDSAWLNHIQFSPKDPDILMFCHEGPWQKVDRIWLLNIRTGKTTLIHKRSMPMEIAGHEWFGKDGKTIWFDLQQPKGQSFFICGTDIASGKEKKYGLGRNEWSVHYCSSRNEDLFAGDGGDSASVAKSNDGKWIYLFFPKEDTIVSEKLVNMKWHNYHLEPNVHFSPDGKWIIFRANFEGRENIYAVEIEKQTN